MATSEADMNRRHDDGHVTAQQWKWTVLAGMASYIDAGSIVALAAGLALWQGYLGMSSSTVGLLAALGPNAFGAAIGALIGGRLGDLFGRKRIYQYDLLVYRSEEHTSELQSRQYLVCRLLLEKKTKE